MARWCAAADPSKPGSTTSRALRAVRRQRQAELRRRAADAVDRVGRTVGLAHDAEEVAAQPARIRQHDRERGRGGGRRIRRVAARCADAQPGLDRERVTARDRERLPLDARPWQSRRHRTSMTDRDLRLLPSPTEDGEVR